jgi:hypothetical protein
MKMSLCTALCAAALMLAAGTASADPWKDESGKGQWRGATDGRVTATHRDGIVLRIPPGHLPPPGECRVWRPGVPAGHQPPPFRC